MNRNIKSIFIVSMYLIFITLVIAGCFLISKKLGSENSTSTNVTVFITVSGILITGLVSVLFKPISKLILPALEDLLFGGILSRDCRMLVFGQTRTGKSSFLKRRFSLTKTSNTLPTDDYRLYKFQTPYSMGQEQGERSPQYINMILADYQGEDPADLIVDYDKNFFGPEGSRKINLLIFMVDLLKEYRKDEEDPKSKIADSEVVEIVKDDVIEHVVSRATSNMEYINRTVLSCIGRLSVGENASNICGVGIFINKIDFLERFKEKGYIPKELLSQQGCADLNSYALKLYSPLEGLLAEFCHELKLDVKPKTFVVSAEQGTGFDDFIDSSFESYMKKKTERKI